MTRGKRTCRILKDIRRQIAEANGIEFVTSECRYKGDCLGTCPKCEAEVRYLEEQLRSRSLAGKAIALAGLSAGMLIFTGCAPKAVETEAARTVVEDTIETEMGDIAVPEDTISEVAPVVEEEPASMRQITELLIVGEDPNYSDDEDCEENTLLAQGTINVNEGVNEVNKEMVVGEVELDNPKELLRDSTSVIPSPMVEKKAQFPGGEAEMYKWLSSNIEYPSDAVEEGASGRVVVEFVVERDGSISNVIILRSRHPSLDKEAVRLVKAMPKWTPGEIEGRIVRVRYILPVTFKLPAEEK